MYRKIVINLLVFVIQILGVSSLKILGIFPNTGRSHFHVYEPILKGLSEKGHHVTVIGYFQFKEKMEVYRDILVGDTNIYYERLENSSNLQNLNAVDDTSRKQMYTTFLVLSFLGRYSCEHLFESKNVQNFLLEDNKFDVILTEHFNSDCTLAIAKKYGCPIVRVHSATLMPWSDYRFGNPINPAYIPNNFLPFSDEMSFLERLENTLLTLVQSIYFNVFEIRSNNEIVGKYFGNGAKTLDSDIFNDSLLLVNTHFSLNLPRPLVPNIIEIGGISIGESKPLEQDLQKWIDESKDGVIYFSLGSVIKGHSMPEDKKNAFFKAFQRLPQRVIWKWENDTMEGKSDNIRIGKWLPQFDILSHPNVKAFISHGGLLGTMEAVHSGTPMVIMPQMGDQHTNAQAMQKARGGVILYLSEANYIVKDLEGKFQKQMKELSERFRDRPMSPLDTAIYWIEYVARHKGAHFMKTAAVNMPLYQYYLLDVLAFIVLILSVVSYIIYITVRAIIRKIFGPSKAKPKSKQKKL